MNPENPERELYEGSELTSREPEKADEALPHDRAVEIAGGGNYEMILAALESEGLIDGETVRIHERYGGLLESATWMTPEDWEMLAVMDCYDEKTALHCVETYRIAKDRVERFTLGGKKFSELIEEEGLLLPEFYRACLFHDIGKCCVPRSIINNHLTDADFGRQLCTDVFRGGREELLHDIERTTGKTYEDEWGNDEALQAYLRAHHVHAMRFIPAAEVLSHEDVLLVRGRFPHIDLETATLADLIVPHEEESERILKEEGFVDAADIAGKHHNYRNLPNRFPIATGSVGVSAALEELLALSDMEQAISAQRSYKAEQKMVTVLATMITEIEARGVNNIIATAWITQELAHISEEERALYSESEERALREINTYITLHEPEVKHFVETLTTRTEEHATPPISLVA